jgi:hypothetical protein
MKPSTVMMSRTHPTLCERPMLASSSAGAIAAWTSRHAGGCMRIAAVRGGFFILPNG